MNNTDAGSTWMIIRDLVRLYQPNVIADLCMEYYWGAEITPALVSEYDNFNDWLTGRDSEYFHLGFHGCVLPINAMPEQADRWNIGRYIGGWTRDIRESVNGDMIRYLLVQVGNVETALSYRRSSGNSQWNYVTDPPKRFIYALVEKVFESKNIGCISPFLQNVNVVGRFNEILSRKLAHDASWSLIRRVTTEKPLKDYKWGVNDLVRLVVRFGEPLLLKKIKAVGNIEDALWRRAIQRKSKKIVSHCKKVNIGEMKKAGWSDGEIMEVIENSQGEIQDLDDFPDLKPTIVELRRFN